MQPVFGSGWAAPGLERHPHGRGGMAHRNVETLIGRLATDPTLRRRFAADPARVLDEFTQQGYELTAIELEALASTDADAVRSFADALDRRIRRADAGADVHERS